MDTDAIKDLFENTDKTIEQISKEVGSTLGPVYNFICQQYSKTYRKKRKSRTYRASKIGELNPMYGKHPSNYIGECEDGKGYLTIYKPKWYTGRAGSERVFVHSVVMAEALGLTEIPRGFCVHHIDGNGKNNKLSNLALVSISAHGKMHQNCCKVQRLSRKGVGSK